MNKQKLKYLEEKFLSIYPEGFQSEDMIAVGKKHNVGKLSEYVTKVCQIDYLNRGNIILEDLIKIITKSSMVSVFEKMRFRDTAREFSSEEKALFVYAIKALIHGDEREGFNTLIYLLIPYKLAKWTIITAFRAYYNLDYDVFVKPTTVKKIIKYLELNDVVYQPLPDYDIYVKYRNDINNMKRLVSKSLSPNNPAFSGFLMMMIDA